MYIQKFDFVEGTAYCTLLAMKEKKYNNIQMNNNNNNNWEMDINWSLDLESKIVNQLLNNCIKHFHFAFVFIEKYFFINNNLCKFLYTSYIHLEKWNEILRKWLYIIHICI